MCTSIYLLGDLLPGLRISGRDCGGCGWFSSSEPGGEKSYSRGAPWSMPSRILAAVSSVCCGRSVARLTFSWTRLYTALKERRLHSWRKITRERGTYHPVPNPTSIPRTTLAILITFVGVSILPRWSRSASSAIREATNTESRTLGWMNLGCVC
jgi:hypothetical protein